MGNVITALTSDQMIAPSYWVDPKSGNDYLLTVQYPENQVKNLADLQGHSVALAQIIAIPTRLDAVSDIKPHPSADRSGSLSTAPRDGCLCAPRKAKIWATSLTASNKIVARNHICRKTSA